MEELDAARWRLTRRSLLGTVAGFCQSSRQRRLNEQYAEQSSDHAVTINRAELSARK
jgi:hypothetical protein